QENLSALSSLAGFCLEAIARHNKPDTVSEKRGGQWVQIPATEFIRRIRHIALGLAALGIKPGDRVALLSENRPEWSIADLAILSLGGVNVPIYTTQAVDQVEYILNDSGARVLFVSGRKVFKHEAKAIDGLALSVLPLSHIFERAGFYVFCYNGVSVYYCSSFEQVGEHLREVRPTVMTAVPRLFEKVYHRIVKKGMSAKGWRRRVFLRAMAVG